MISWNAPEKENGVSSHDLRSPVSELTSEARDGGYFSSLKPVDRSLSGKTTKQRKSTSGRERPISDAARGAVELLQDTYASASDLKGKGKAKEEVVLEKSNVLMM